MSDVDQKVTELLTRFKVDRASASQTLDALDAVREAQDSLAKATDSGSGSAVIQAVRQQADAQNQLAQAIDEVAQATQKATQARSDFNVEALRADTQKALSAPDNQPETGGGSSGLAAGLRTGSQLASAVGLGGVAEPLRIAGDIARLQDELPKLGESLAGAGVNVSALGAVVAPLGGLAIGAAIGMKVLDAELEKSKQTLSASLTAQDAYYKALGTMTTEQVQQELQTRQQGQTALQAQIKETQGAIDSAFQQAVGQFGDAGARVLDAAGKLPTAQLRDQLAKLQTQADTDADTIARLSEGLANGAFAANDAAEAEKRLAEERTKAALASADIAKTAASEDLQLSQGTAKAAQDRAQAYLIDKQSQEAYIRSLLDSGDQSQTTTDAIHAAQAKILDDWARYNDILDNVVPPLQANEQAEFQLEQARKGVLAISQEMVTAEQANAQAQQQLTQAQKAYADGLDKANATLQNALDTAKATEQQAIDSAESQASSARLDAQQQANDALADAQLKANEARADAERNFRETIARIDRTFNQAATSAIADRNAVALAQAKQQKNNETADAKRAEKDKLADIDRSLKDEQRTIDRRYKEQLQKIDAALAKQVADAQQKYQQAVQAAQQSYQQQLTSLQSALDQQQAIADAAHAKMLAAEQAFWDAVQAQVPAPPTNATNYTPPAFASGGTPPINRVVSLDERGTESGLIGGRTFAVFGKPTTIFNASQTAAMLSGASGGIHITLNGLGMSKKEIVRHVSQELERSLEHYVEGQDG